MNNTEIEPETFHQHKDFLEEYIDPDYGLLDKLQSSNALTAKEIRLIKNQLTFDQRNAKLLEYVTEQNKYNSLINALKEKEQEHIVNYLIGKGEYRLDFGEDWPLTEAELKIIDTNQETLIDLVDPSELVGLLYSRKVINKRQRDAINSNPACHEKNEFLLEILRRRSLKDFKVTIKCLRESNQRHVAEVLEKGGVVVKLHAQLQDDKTEDEIIEQFAQILKERSHEESSRIIEGLALKVIAMKKGESIVLYVYCDTVTLLVELQEMQISGYLKKCIQKLITQIPFLVENAEVTVDNLRRIVETLFTQLLHRSQIKDMEVTLSKEEYNRCRTYFSEAIKLRAAYDFSPDKLNRIQKNELKDILQSTTNSLKDEGSTFGDKAIIEQEEDKWEDVVGEEEGNAEGEMKDDECSEGDQWTGKEDKEKFKSIAQIKEDELESRPSTCFQTEDKPADFKDEIGTRLSQTQEEASMTGLEDSEHGSEDSKTESEYSESSSQKSENFEVLNLNAKTLSFRKGDQLGTIPPTNIGDAINWWKVIHTESGEIGYIPRNLVVIDYTLNLNQRYKTSTKNNQAANSSMSNLLFEILDSILLKAYLELVMRENQALKNKDYEAIRQLSSVDCCWFQRIRKMKFKKKAWRLLVGFYRRQEKASSLYRINRQYLEENIRLKGLVNRLKFNDCLTDVQTASLYRQNLLLGKKDSFERFRDLISEVVKNIETVHSVFRRSLCDTKQHLIAEVIENGGAMSKVEIMFQKAEISVKTRHQNLHIAERVSTIRDKMKAASHQIEELVGKLKQDDLEILSAGQDGDVTIVWIRNKTKYALEKLQTLNKSKHIADVFTEEGNSFSFSSEERNHAMIKPKVNIDFEQFENTVVFFSIVANFISRLNLERAKDEEDLRTEMKENVWGLTKLRSKIHVLLIRHSTPRWVIDVFEDQNPFHLQKSIEIEEIENPRDIASIEKENSLYVLDSKGCVWKIKEEGDEKEKQEKIMRWLDLKDYYGPGTLSVTRGSQLLMVSQREGDALCSLWIFGGVESEKAELRLSISLPEEIQNPIHAVETSRGNFIILHEMKRKKEEESESDEGRRRMEEEVWMVSEVSEDGETILHRFIPRNEEQKLWLDHLFGHLAVGSLEPVILADFWNDRVIILDSDLRWKGILIPTEEDGKEERKILRPRRLFYDEEKKQLIVGDRKEVFVYTLNRKFKN